MADEVTVVQGRDRLLTVGGGPPTTSVFVLSSKPISWNLANPAVGDFYEATDFSSMGEITGWTGPAAYARKSLATPAPSSGIITYQTLPDPLWDTQSAVDGPAIVPTLALVDAVNSRLYRAWDLRPLRQALTTAGVTLPAATITVDDTTPFELSGTIWIPGQPPITYTGKSGTTLTGCSGGSGVIAIGTTVQQAPDMSKQNSQIRLGYDATHALRWFLQEP